MIRIQTIGEGPPLVLLHGWAMHGGVFAPLIQVLAPHRTLHVVDLPGHGDSPWNAEHAFTLRVCVDALVPNIPRAPWLGWSLGGLVALRAAIDGSDHVTGIVALAATPRFTRAPDWPNAVEDALLDEFARGLEVDHRATVKRFLALEAHGSDHLREDLRFLQHEILARPAPHPRVLQDGLAVLRETDMRAELGRLSIPSLWIGGRRDRLVPPSALEASARLAPGGEAVSIAHAGHAPFLSHADAVARAVLDWLETHAL